MSSSNNIGLRAGSESVTTNIPRTGEPRPGPPEDSPITQNGSVNQPKMWEHEDPYQYPIPKPEGDCWNLVLEEKLKGDRIQCDAWKDEVQNLLIFAGLFSAVVTAFIIESYKTLRPDPNETIIFLLHRIANDPDISPPRKFTPTASTTRINIFWFLSLILSLATVLIGIISLQWLREHQRYTVDITQRKALAVFHMRAQGLEAWYVRQIFTALPLLLQGALVLFLLGVADFLFSLDFIVAIPVTVGISFTLLFLVTTTMLPTLQLFVNKDLNKQSRSAPESIPVQCPYRSPQSWIFFRLSSLVYTTLRRVRLVSSVIITNNLTLFPFRFALCPSKPDAIKSWISFDSWWLTIPEVYVTRPDAHRNPYYWGKDYDVDSLCRVIKLHPSQTALPTYIEAESLLEALKRYSSNSTTVAALYYCVQEVSGDTTENNKRYVNALFDLYYIQREPELKVDDRPFLPYCAPSRLLNDLSNLTTSGTLHPCNHDEHLIWFIGAILEYGYPQTLKTQLVSHFVELNSRSTSYLLSKNRDIPVENRNTYRWLWRRKHNMFPGALEQSLVGDSIPDDVFDATITQYYLILDNFIRQAAEVKNDTSLRYTTYNEPLLDEFLSIASQRTGPRTQNAQVDQYLHPMLQQTIQFISATLHQTLVEEDPRPLLFLTASYLLGGLFKGLENLQYDSDDGTKLIRIKSWNYDPVYSEPILSLIDALSRYYDHFQPKKGGYDSFRPSHKRPFTQDDIYVWNIGPNSELTGQALPVDKNTISPSASNADVHSLGTKHGELGEKSLRNASQIV